MPHLGHIKTHNFSVPSSPNCFFVMTSVDNTSKLPKKYVFFSWKNNNIHLKHFCRAVWNQGTVKLKKGFLSLVDATAFRNKDHLVGGWTNPFETNMLIKLDHLPRLGWISKYLKALPSHYMTPTQTPCPIFRGNRSNFSIDFYCLSPLQNSVPFKDPWEM